jgi:aromatic-L-amino-acid decarboxylase
MFNKEEFRTNAIEFVNWMTEYLSDVEKYPVRAQTSYGEIRKRFPAVPPDEGESLEAIFYDFKHIIIPGITHWQSPKYFAYFPANSSPPSVLAEMLTATLAVQGMKWITSPAATELEELVTEWLRLMLGLPDEFTGVIQDTASVATLCAILAAREKATRLNSNQKGIGNEILRVYCSTEAHSSIEKAVRIAGLGSDNLVKIEVNSQGQLIPEILEACILDDIKMAYKPVCIVAALGTTGVCALDPIDEMGKIANKYNAWFHVDAAFAGTALLLPEFRNRVHGLQRADSFVFNPHKWMFTNFDCSVFFVKDKKHLQDTFRLVPGYLQTEDDREVNDYSNWGIQLGRRFRALKLWFVIRNFGVVTLQNKLREHISLASYFEERIRKYPEFDIVVPRILSVVCFRFIGSGNTSQSDLDSLNSDLLELINSSGRIFISHTIFNGNYILRFVCAQTYTEKHHVDEALDVILHYAQVIK